MLVLLDSSSVESLLGVFSEFSYLAPFTVLLLCGLGLPLPEEVTLIGSGILLHRGEVRFLEICAVCIGAILLGDSIPYWLGRRYGLAALRLAWVSRVLHPERFARFEKRFREHGVWAVFVCRFLAGVRIPGYFVAGMMGMGYGRFLLIDAAGALLSVPASIYLGKLFGGSLESLERGVKDLNLILGFLVLSLALILILRSRRARAARAEPVAADAICEELPADGGAAESPRRTP